MMEPDEEGGNSEGSEGEGKGIGSGGSGGMGEGGSGGRGKGGSGGGQVLADIHFFNIFFMFSRNNWLHLML